MHRASAAARQAPAWTNVHHGALDDVVVVVALGVFVFVCVVVVVGVVVVGGGVGCDGEQAEVRAAAVTTRCERRAASSLRCRIATARRVGQDDVNQQPKITQTHTHTYIHNKVQTRK